VPPAVVCYDSRGRLLWDIEVSPITAAISTGRTVSVDPAGGIAVAGFRHDPETSRPFLVLTRIAADGEVRWTRTHDWEPIVGGPSDVGALSVTAGGPDRTYLTFPSVRPGTGTDFTAISYNSSGRVEWIRRYDYAFGNDGPADAAVDVAGNLIVTGHGIGATSFDILTLKYSPTGELLWNAKFNGSAARGDFARLLALDPSGGIAVAGSTITSNGREAVVTLRYDASGRRLWARGLAPSGISEPTALALDTQGNTLLTGVVPTSGLLAWRVYKYGAGGQ
jgi:hypothetical protein